MYSTGRTASIRLILILFILTTSQVVMAQDPLDAITFTFEDVNNAANDYTATSPSNAGQTIDDNTTYDIFFSRNTTTNNNRNVSSFTIGATVYSFLLDPDTLALRRVGSATRLSLWIEAEMAVDNTADEIYLAPERQVPERSLYQANLLNIGYDNVLVNSGTNSSNIERIDAIYATGMLTSTPANAIIPVMDRGHNGEFKIAMITSLDASGDPASYGDLVEVNAGDFGAGVVSFSLSVLFLQQSLGEDPIPTGSSTQNLGGVGISLADMGITANQIVYGYSLFSTDVDDGIHDLTDITTFPTNSSNSGLDLAAGAVSAVSSDGNLVKATGPGGYKASLSTWLKANAGVTTATDNSGVSDWQDQSLGDHDATNLGTAPTYRDGSASGLQDINFNPTVDFIAATERGLQIADNSDYNVGGEPYTTKSFNIAFRTGASDVTTKQQLYEQGGTTRGVGIYIESGQLFLSAWNQNDDDGAGSASPWNTGSTISVISTAVTADTEYIVTMEFNGSSGGTGTLTAYLNGQSFGSFGSVGQLFDHGDDIGLGDVDGGSRYETNTTAAASFYGSIPEFIYCSEPGSFSSAQRNRIESYLALKYGVTLDQSSPVNYVNSQGDVIFNTTNNASIGGYLEYNNNIAGIGRDDDSEFEQKTSQSENANSLVRISRSGDIGINDTWLIWGHDGASATTTDNTDKPPLISERIDRVWRVAEEGSMGVTDLSFDITDLGFGTDPADFSLLIADNSSNATFLGATTTIGGTTSTIDGRTFLTFADVDLSHGEYFSLGTGFISCGPGGITSNLAFWIKADLGTSSIIDGNTVSTWSDQAGSNDAASADLGGGSPETPTYQTGEINSNPIVRFTDPGNTNSAFYSINRPAEDDFSVIAVYSSTQNDSGPDSDESPAIVGASAGTGSDNDWAMGYSDSEVHFKADQANNGFGAFTSGAEDFTNGVPRLLTGIRQIGTGNPDGFLYVNSVFLDSDGSNNNTLNSASTAGIGNHGAGNANTSAQFAGDLAEVIVYSDDLSSSDQNLVESYLAIKYGISRNGSDDGSTGSVDERDYRRSDGTVTWDFSDQSLAYNTDITGIGRDDDACLNQKQSGGVASSAIVSMGLGSIAATNNANTNNFSTDGDFLTWGHDGTTASTIQSTDVPGTVTDRLSRIWHVQETGTVGNTQLSFDLTGLGLSSNAADFQLITSSSETMASGTTISGGTFNGNILSFDNVDFADGDFFTLGTARTTCGPGNVTTGLALWLRADAGTNTTTDGANITSWTDQSSSANNASEDNNGGGAPVEPTYQDEEINFNPSIRFSNAESNNNSWLETASNSTDGDMTLISVFKTAQSDGSASNFTDSPALVSGEAAGTDDYALGLSEGRLYINATTNNNFNIRPATSYTNEQPRIATGTRLQASSATGINLYVDSENVGTATSNTTALDAAGTFAIGNHSVYDADGQFEGDIAEVIVFDQVLSETDQAQVETYLAIKYGITRSVSALSEAAEDYLASDGGVIWNIDAQGVTYHNDIAGIGRDDNSCFLQEKSTSANTDALVTIERSAALNTDDSFLVWGNDDAAIEEAGNTEKPAGISSRLNREWRVQETGTVGNVTLTYDLSTITGPTGVGTNNLNQLRLMVDNDGDFNAGVTLISPTSIDAVNNTVSFTVNFSDGQYYTLGSQESAALPVTLISFEALATVDNKVDVRWATATESGNAFFTIERSTDGTNFEAIAQLDGAGDADQVNRYRYTDQNPVLGMSYYRLKQTDFNGEFTFSEISGVRLLPEQNLTVKLYPNPVSPSGSMKVETSAGKNLLISIYDLKGRLYYQKENPQSHRPLEIPMDQFQRGMYLLRITDQEKGISISKRFIVR